MRFFYALLLYFFLAPQLNATEKLINRLKDGMKLVEEIKVVAHGVGKLEFLSSTDLWLGFNFEFPEEMIVEYKDEYIFEVKDINSYASVSTGPIDNSASTVFSAKKGKIVISYKNNTSLNYRVIFWARVTD